jgi:hypothetical protein
MRRVGQYFRAISKVEGNDYFKIKHFAALKSTHPRVDWKKDKDDRTTS